MEYHANTEQLTLPESVLNSAMRRALDLAKLGPSPDPNPRVGAVILDPEGRIVAEGWHRGAGSKHAEVDALAQLPDVWLSRAHDLTGVVTLEPCNHTGKTGPCSQALLDFGIGTVVFGLDDPGPVSSGGAETLRAGGVRVVSGVHATAVRALLLDWLLANFSAPKNLISRPTQNTHPKRPYIIAKWAQTLDGRAAATDGSSQWITGEHARAHVHLERALADAILVGTGTVVADDPALTARNTAGELLVPASQQPIPVIFGSRDLPRISKTSVLSKTSALSKTTVLPKVYEHPALKEHGLEEPLRVGAKNLETDLADLKTLGINSIYIEGGPKTTSCFLAAGLVDEVHIYLAPKLVGGQALAVTELGVNTIATALKLDDPVYLELGEDLLVIAKTEVHETVEGRK